MQKWHKKDTAKPSLKPKQDEASLPNYAAIDLGTNSCRIVIATPTPSSFRIVETFSKITRLGEGIINNNELSKPAIKRTIGALKVCAGVLAEYAPIHNSRFVATAACRRATNCKQFLEQVKKETGLSIETISTQEEARLAVVGCIPLLARNIKRALIFDIGGGSTEISLARTTNSGNTFIEGYVSSRIFAHDKKKSAEAENQSILGEMKFEKNNSSSLNPPVKRLDEMTSKELDELLDKLV